MFQQWLVRTAILSVQNVKGKPVIALVAMEIGKTLLPVHVLILNMMMGHLLIVSLVMRNAEIATKLL